ncbi:hypothetical protein [Sinosporangium siamense]|uniref:Uncharacterized protein n=1 Tax=Sinosporangium siamense TaxID=1367973 RepID=A0A919RP32_9ACTN|nr:hypothetical protein [Sinosporangium siamense]GII96029.1 hypothetical protein Ssi02_62600 [Sinosporangium siamense]
MSEHRPRPQTEVAAPRKVARIRIGSFALVLLFGLGVLTWVAGVYWLTIVLAVAFVAVAVGITLASWHASGEAG